MGFPGTLKPEPDPALRVVGLITSMVPYHHVRWQAFADFSGAACWVVELTNRDEFAVLEVKPNSTSGYQRLSVFAGRDARTLNPAEVERALHRILQSIQPDVVCVNGYASAMSYAGLQWCRENQRPAVICSESNAFDQSRSVIKEFVKRQVLQGCSAGLAGGQPQAAYLAELGIPRERIFTGYDVVDNDHFAVGADAARSQDATLRRKLSLPDQYFLACARFTEKKNYSLLIDAFAHYRSTMEALESGKPGAKRSWSLLLLGDGPLRPVVEAQVATLGLGEYVQFRGAIPYAELPTYYGLAGAFVHASKVEQWGLGVTEAMASGLPVVVSDCCGCVSDLVVHGENGLLFDPSDQVALSQCMLDIALQDGRRAAMGQASRERVREWGPDRFARGLYDAVACAREASPARRDWFGGVLLRLLGKWSA